MKDFSSNLQLAIEAAKTAGRIVKDGFGNIKKIDNKDNGTIVTNVDRESEEAILKILQAKSDYAIFSEEAGKIKGRDGLWVIDPIDGTTNFSRGIPFCCISIALIKENKIELGVIYNPILDELYFAEKDKGAHLNDKRIYISKQESLAGSVVFVNSGYNLEDKKRYAETIKGLLPYCTLRKFGTSAFELCLVADGSTDAFICSGDELYDYAAGLIIVKEAGGKVTDWEGNEWNNTNTFILASNSKIHNELLEILSKLQ